jgi:phosphate-selective porin
MSVRRTTPDDMARALVAAVLLLVAPCTAPAQTPSPGSTPPTTVDGSRGGVTITSGVNSLRIGARAQFRWTTAWKHASDEDALGVGAGLADGALGEFDIPSMRVTLSGGVYRPWLRYEFEFDFSRTDGEAASTIKDMVLEIRPAGGNYRIVAGQFKAPFGLQTLVSSARLQFVDRALTHTTFNPGREMGVMLGGAFLERKVGVDAGVFNGSGESAPQDNRSTLWVGRVYVQPLGPYAPAEGASDGGAPLLHIGAAVRGGEAVRGRSSPDVVDEADNERAFSMEAAFKARRFFATAEGFWMTNEQRNPLPGPDLGARGYHAQAGYMIRPRTTELGILYSRIEGDTTAADAAVTELRGGVGYYWQSHSLKLQADFGVVGYGANFAALPERARQGLPPLGNRLVANQDLSDRQLRVQMTLMF